MAASRNRQILSRLLQEGFAALQSGKLTVAEATCQKILKIDSNIPQGHFLVGLIALETKNRKLASNAFHTVTQLDPKNEAAWAHLAKVFSELGYTANADEALSHAEALGTDNPVIQNVIGSVWSLLGEHNKAREWYALAYGKAPEAASFGVNLANAESFTGHIDSAQQTILNVLKTSPDNPQAHWVLAGLQKAKNAAHAQEMEKLATTLGKHPHAAAFLYYGAGKEYEDIEAWDRAFQAFQAGARARRKIITYDEAEEEKLFNVLKEGCTAEWFKAGQSTVSNDAPIFIIGQPRTGTTLIERIITSHSQIASAGELQQFYLSLRRQAGINSPARQTAQLMQAAINLDPSKLGEAYSHGTKNYAAMSRYFVDKMPINFLYAPLIARALPNAKFIHLKRNPMDSCFSSYKQLFADAYLHSYDLPEMARHHIRYLQMMACWRDLLGDRLLEVSYEDTVHDMESQARRIISSLNVPWEEACLDFHKQTAAVSTASATQVREPVHTKSVGRWRRYEEQLEPARLILTAAGVDF